MLFDSHVHFFPDKLSGKVLPKLAEISNSNYFRGETLNETIIENNKYNVTHALGLHIATNSKQEKSVNDFAITSQTENILCFGSVHPQSENKISELYRIAENGLKGIKLHPDYQDFFSNDTSMSTIYETCEKLGLMIAFHTGLDPYSPDVVHNTPKAMSEVARAYPNLTIISAHLGGMNMPKDTLEYLVGLKNVYLDTAMTSSFLSTQQFEEIVRLHGVERVLFATDSPWSTAETEIELIEKTNLTKEEKEKIYYKNAFKLFNIDI